MILAQKQFNYSRELHTEDSIGARNNDSITNIRFKEDTLKQLKREIVQEKRNQLQDKANNQQFLLNKSQLKAIQLQAEIAKEQFNQQLDQYNQQIYEQRAVFVIDSIHIIKMNSVKSTIEFTFTNRGIRTAHIDSTVLAFYNKTQGCFSVTPSNSNLDLIPNQNFQRTTPIGIFNDCLKDKYTVFYLLIYYKDKTTGKNQVEPMFFTWQYSSNKQFMYSRARGDIVDEFKKRLKSKYILVLD